MFMKNDSAEFFTGQIRASVAQIRFHTLKLHRSCYHSRCSLLFIVELMQKIMSLAQNFQQDQDPPPQQTTGFPDFDPALLQTLMGFAQENGIDSHQQALLNALHPYLNQHRISKLERAMRAAKMAGMVTTLLPNPATGR